MASEEDMLREWRHFENVIGQSVPEFLKLLLSISGYDTLISIKQFTSPKITNLEQWINDNFHANYEPLVKLFGNNAFNEIALYKNIFEQKRNFTFLPGHRDILLNLPKMITEMQTKKSEPGVTSKKDNLPKYSAILTKLIESANKNFNKSKNAYTYNDTIKFFSTYVFLLYGRACYETLCHNLPIPSTKTIRKYIQ